MNERAADGSKGLVEAFWERVAEEASAHPEQAAPESPEPARPVGLTAEELRALAAEAAAARPAHDAEPEPVPRPGAASEPAETPPGPPAERPLRDPPPEAPVTGPPAEAPVTGPPAGASDPRPMSALASGQLTDAFIGAYNEPELALAEYPLRIDDDTLREIADDTTLLELIREGLTRKIADAADAAARARLLGLRAVTSRLLGLLREALDDAERALQHAHGTGSARKVAVAQTRLARVLQWRGDHAVADELYQRALDAAIPDRLRAAIHHHAGVSCFDQGRFVEAIHHFESALALRHSQDAEQLAATGRAFTAISRRASEQGFGPFPRTRAEILQEPAPPRLRFHDVFRRYGYADADDKVVIPPTFHQAYPFSEGLAWVQADESGAWSLIDSAGETRISSTDYQTVGPFTEGLAWVMSDPVLGWQAIDQHGIVVVPPAGYTSARPFHAGLAAVRRNNAWGAVDRDGREVIPMEYDAFRTARSDSSYLIGFTEEGLAVVERDGLLGVINRSNDVIVPPAFQVLEIHPLAFLVAPPVKTPDYTDPFRAATRTVGVADGWGALDRGGDLIIDTAHPNRAAVLEELEKLLRDAHPIL